MALHLSDDATPRHIRETFDADDCPVDDCDVERFSRVGMEYHLIREHGY